MTSRRLPASTADTEKRARGVGSLYRPAERFAIRAPLLPAATFSELGAVPGWLQRALADSRVIAAIAVASPNLAREISKAAGVEDACGVDQSGNGKSTARLADAVLRYLIRMSTRPTPFGLFAGIALGRWGDRTDLAMQNGSRPARVRPDLAWLMDLALTLERDRDAKRELSWAWNSCAYEHRGRMHVAQPSSSKHTSIRATSVVREVMRLADGAVPWSELVAGIRRFRPDVSEAKMRGLLDTLCEQGYLCSDLRVTLTSAPLDHVVAKLGATHRVETLRGLRKIQQLARDAEQMLSADPAAGIHCLGNLREEIVRTHGFEAPESKLIQVDSGLMLSGETLSTQIARDVTKAAELLLRLHPSPGGPRHLRAFRAAFVRRYGVDRRVPLLELLDPKQGIGPPTSLSTHAHRVAQVAVRRTTRLLALATLAIRDGRDEVELTEQDIEQLCSWTPKAREVPSSLDLNVFVLANDRSAIDQSDYRLLIGPNLGANAAGRGIGRFGDVLGRSGAVLRSEIAAAEARGLGGAIAAELVYLPRQHRSMNVAARPHVHEYEIPVGVSSSVAQERSIRPSELDVFVRDDRLRLWWARGETEVAVFAGHMLNTLSAPVVCRFLSEMGLDGITSITAFDWGVASQLPMTPRVRVGRVILCPSRWRLSRKNATPNVEVKSAAEFGESFQKWRARWRAPRRVYLSSSDNRLLLDLDEPLHLEQLRSALRRGDDVLLEEALPGVESAWLPGPGGGYVSELCVPLMQPGPTVPDVGAQVLKADAGNAQIRRAVASRRRSEDRVRPPGSEWLYVVLYGPQSGHDALIRGPLAELAAQLLASGEADGWFFLRYADPAEQIRLRFHGDPTRLLDQVLPKVMRWAAGLINEGKLVKIALDCYEREVERYGGTRGIEICEAVFEADSEAVATLLAEMVESAEMDRLEWAARTVDDLLRGLGLDATARLGWYGDHAPPSKETSTAYRQRGQRLQKVLAGELDIPRSGQLEQTLAKRRHRLLPLGMRFSELSRSGELIVSLSSMFSSLVHMHCNRMGIGPDQERILIGLLHRTRKALTFIRRS